jgi:23S rRNA (cytosine1962-C5)-methyltransferase
MAMDPEAADRYRNQAAMLANKVLKRYRHLRKRFARENIEVFRLYDWDIPEIRAVVDWYGGHLVIGEYTRTQSTPEWLPLMGAAVAEALGVPREKLHLKERRAGFQGGRRYRRLDFTNRRIVVAERDFRFYVNPYDYIDTGLFSDHRNTRQMVREASGARIFSTSSATPAPFRAMPPGAGRAPRSRWTGPKPPSNGPGKTWPSTPSPKRTTAWCRPTRPIF